MAAARGQACTAADRRVVRLAVLVQTGGAVDEAAPVAPAAVAELVRTVTTTDEARTSSLVDGAVAEASADVRTQTTTLVNGAVAERVPF